MQAVELTKCNHRTHNLKKPLLKKYGEIGVYVEQLFNKSIFIGPKIGGLDM